MYNYIYTAIIVVFIISLIFLVKKLIGTFKILASVNNSIESISGNVDKINIKVEKIKKSKESFKFFFAIYIIIVIIKETLQNRKNESTGKALSKSCIKHASQLAKL